MLITISAVIFMGLSIFVALFQFLLFLKKPWGEYTMGGIHPGILPKPYRVAAFIQLWLILFNGIVILGHADLIHLFSKNFSESWLWVIMIMMSFSTVLNLITQSKKERYLWAPITLIMLICSILVYFL